MATKLNFVFYASRPYGHQVESKRKKVWLGGQQMVFEQSLNLDCEKPFGAHPINFYFLFFLLGFNLVATMLQNKRKKT
jgi:hypothetical protein